MDAAAKAVGRRRSMIDEKRLLKALQGFYEREEEYKRVADENNIDYEPQTGLIDEIIKYVQKMQSDLKQSLLLREKSK